MKHLNVIGSQVQKLRQQQNLTQEELIVRCQLIEFDLTSSALSLIETNARTVTDLEFIMLAKALRVDMSELIPHKLPKWKKRRVS